MALADFSIWKYFRNLDLELCRFEYFFLYKASIRKQFYFFGLFSSECLCSTAHTNFGDRGCTGLEQCLPLIPFGAKYFTIWNYCCSSSSQKTSALSDDAVDALRFSFVPIRLSLHNYFLFHCLSISDELSYFCGGCSAMFCVLRCVWWVIENCLFLIIWSCWVGSPVCLCIFYCIN